MRKTSHNNVRPALISTTGTELPTPQIRSSAREDSYFEIKISSEIESQKDKNSFQIGQLHKWRRGVSGKLT